MKQDFQTFQSIAIIGLSTLVGILFALPIAFSNSAPLSWMIMLTGLAIGSVTGYKNRTSRGFFYFALIVAATLTTVIYFNLIQNEF